MYLRNSVLLLLKGIYASGIAFILRFIFGNRVLLSARSCTPVTVIRWIWYPWPPNTGDQTADRSNYASLGSYLVHELQDCSIPAEVEVVQKTVLLDKMATSGPHFSGKLDRRLS